MSENFSQGNVPTPFNTERQLLVKILNSENAGGGGGGGGGSGIPVNGGTGNNTILNNPTLNGAIIVPRAVAYPDAATVTLNAATTDVAELQTLSQSSTFANPIGTPNDGQAIRLVIKSTASRGLTWGSQFRGSLTLALPSATTGSGLNDYMQFAWRALDSKWDMISANLGF